jgi:hypothetical protein
VYRTWSAFGRADSTGHPAAGNRVAAGTVLTSLVQPASNALTLLALLAGLASFSQTRTAAARPVAGTRLMRRPLRRPGFRVSPGA